MILKAGTYYCEDNEPQDAEWHYEKGETVQIIHKDCVIVSIDPEDFIAISEAVKERLRRKEE